MTASPYAARPWLTLLTEAQRAPVDPADSLVHALRDAVAEAPDRTFLAYFDARLSYREADELSDAVAAHLAARGLERGDRVAVVLQNSPTSCSPCSAPGRRARPSSRSTPCTSRGRPRTSCGTARWPR
ncbi:hypothetical protein SCANM63S_00634 [Streptomyces canarius]